MTKINNALILAVRDNGNGFDPATGLAPDAAGRGYGLHTMKERMEFAGGVFPSDP